MSYCEPYPNRSGFRETVLDPVIERTIDPNVNRLALYEREAYGTLNPRET